MRFYLIKKKGSVCFYDLCTTCIPSHQHYTEVGQMNSIKPIMHYKFIKIRCTIVHWIHSVVVFELIHNTRKVYSNSVFVCRTMTRTQSQNHFHNTMRRDKHRVSVGQATNEICILATLMKYLI